jgi:hypothetical protein
MPPRSSSLRLCYRKRGHCIPRRCKSHNVAVAKCDALQARPLAQKRSAFTCLARKRAGFFVGARLLLCCLLAEARELIAWSESAWDRFRRHVIRCLPNLAWNCDGNAGHSRCICDSAGFGVSLLNGSFAAPHCAFLTSRWAHATVGLPREFELEVPQRSVVYSWSTGSLPDPCGDGV